MRVRCCALGAVAGATLGAVLSGPARAQVTRATAAREFGDMAADVGYLWASPFRAHRRDWLDATAVTAGFLALLPLDGAIDRWLLRHPRSAVLVAVSPVRESNEELSKLWTVARLVPISGALVIAGMLSDSRELREAGYGCLSGWALSNTLRHSIYLGVSRHRPYVAHGDQYRFGVPGGPWDEHSFFAGHPTNAFACATFWSERFKLGIGEPALYLAATATALSRIADRRHWASDTFLGVAVGYAVGRAVAHRYERRELVRRARGRAGTPRVVIPLWERRF